MMDDILALWPWFLLAIVPLYLLVGAITVSAFDPLYWLIVRLTYRFHVYHRDRIPKEGPALIVSNHVTYIDWMFFWVASPRPVTYVIYAGFLKNPFLRLLLWFPRKRIISLDSKRGPHALAEAMNKITAALDEGRVVVYYPEQTLSRNGQMLPFSRGMEHILKRAKQPVPVIPTYLDGLWGSIFSWHGGKVILKWPRDFRRRIAVYFGEPLPTTVKAVEARAAVQECNALCGIAQSDFVLPVHRHFVRNAAKLRNLRRDVFVDAATGTERTLTWPRALVAAWCLRSWLAKRLGPEQHVGVWLPTGMGSALANIALTFLGKTPVNLNYTAGKDPVESAVRLANIKTVITAKRFLDKIPLALPGAQQLQLEEALGAIPKWEKTLKFLAVLLLPGWFLDRVLLGLGNVKPDDLLTILFSSGSTGEPKGVMMSFRNISSNVDSLVRGVEFTPDDRILCTLPFFHTFGNTVCLWAPLAIGMKAIFYPDPRAAKEIGELCKKHQCTIALGTATFVRFYLRRAEKDDFKSVRLLICGAEKLPVKLAEDFRDKFGVLPMEGYGCTELSPVVSVNLADVALGGLKQKANTMGTVGQPIPGVVVKTFDPETYEPLPHGAEGLLGAKGPNVMLGYLHQLEKTKHVVRDGWYITGDIGVVEDDGFIRITGRVSRFAKIAGEMVPLERLDEEMHDILGTGGDRVLAVAAVPDDKRGERVVVLHLPDVREKLPGLFEQLRGRGLPNLWIPDVRDCYAVESFPVLGSGKLDLRELGVRAKELATKA